MSEGVYLFAVCRGGDLRTDGAAGLRDAPLEVVECEGLTAVTCRVDLDEFGEDGLRQNLEDLTWVEQVARTHNEVVWRVAEQATTAPMRLVTIFNDGAGVLRMLAEHAHGLHESLDAIEGCQEWSVKVYGRPPEVAPRREAAMAEGAGAGAAYLQRKRAAAQLRRTASEEAAVLAERVHHALSERSVASRRLPPQDPRLTGRVEPMLLNSAYLVPEEDATAFAQSAHRLVDAEQGVSVELGGPWPAYSFVTTEWT
jgi:hypothetical protein